MDKHIKHLILIIGLTSMMVGASGRYAAAWDWSEGEGQTSNWEERSAKWESKREEIYKKLGVTQEQAAQLKAQKAQHREGMKGLFQEIKAKREALGAELQKDTISLEAIHAVHNDLKALNARKEDRRLEGILAVRNVLTAEQFKKMMELKEERRQEWRKKFKGQFGSDGGKEGGAPAETKTE